ncbi:MFS general substrate transporter [Rhodotorula diobovata]|uniref:MFS general substrate transporter n=1 Tax=Rhodotorula diobovata TaxID=5288 RepID=A0A5C5FVP5_9BASI|nr:MFS general substrate transporter [Rhodotorula diobovata]
MGFWAKVRTVAWGAPPATRAEAKLLVKIDWFILSFICLMYFSNYLDRANLQAAYVSGMREALDMEGNDLNKVNTVFTVGYTVAMVPQNLLLQVVSARLVFPVMTVTWGALTMATAAAQSTSHLCVIRFFQGMAEASTFVGAHYIIGAWYREKEVAKRAAIFSSAAQVATLFSGVLQARIYTSMNGLHGLEGFRWLFIICGAITIPIGIYGWCCFPDTPERNRSIVFSKAERELAMARIPPRPDTKLDRTVFRRVLGRWRWWVMSLIWIVGGELESVGSNALMALWMKHQVATGAESWNVPNINYYPQGATAVAVVALLGTAVWTDWTGKRHHVNLVIAAVMVVSAVLILCQDQISKAGVFFAFYLAGISYAGQASNFAWANDICKSDEQERAVVLASMNMWSNAFNAWWSIVFFPANDAPKWERGMISIIVLCPVMVGLTSLARYLQLRDQRRARALGPADEAAALPSLARTQSGADLEGEGGGEGRDEAASVKVEEEGDEKEEEALDLVEEEEGEGDVGARRERGRRGRAGRGESLELAE